MPKQKLPVKIPFGGQMQQNGVDLPTNKTIGLPAKQLHRFYEPLVLLHTLGKTRGERTSKHSTSTCVDDLCQLSTRDLRRRFLIEIAYICDYEKGGETVTAIGLEQTPQEYTFWVGVNQGPEKRIIPFLRSLIESLKALLSAQGNNEKSKTIQDSLENACIKFTAPKIRKYWSLLKRALQKCLLHPGDQILELVPDINLWLRKLEEHKLDYFELCTFAYQNRKSPMVKKLQILGQEPSYKCNGEGLQGTCADARHLIGRLAHHFRAPRVIVGCAYRLETLLYQCTVKGIPSSVVEPISPPPVRQKTRLDSMIIRMLPSDSAKIDLYRTAMDEMDRAFDLNQKFCDTYKETNFHPRIHAEVQVLEHFYTQNLRFVEDDRYIAASKAACFCCQLYFRYHPGNFVEPDSHRKIYINWLPPPPSVENHSRIMKIVNLMTIDIRKEVLHQLDQRAHPSKWHPDSVTGITESVNVPKELTQSSLTEDDSSGNNQIFCLPELSSQDEDESKSTRATSLPGPDDVSDGSSNHISRHAANEIDRDKDSDSSDEGGVLLSAGHPSEV